MNDHALLEKLLNLPEFEITDLKHNDDDIRIFVKKREKPTVCLHCGVSEPRLRVHAHVQRELRDISMQNKRVGLMIDQIKYKCMECHTIFPEPLDCAPYKARMTTRLREYIEKQAITLNFTDVSRDTGISIEAVKQTFIDYANTHIPQSYKPATPTTLGIDEIHIQKQGKHRKQAWAVICNGDQGTVIDVLENRNKDTVISYLKSLPLHDKIKLVTMDMWEQYRDAVYEALPKAIVVVDKFHVQKMGNEALNSIRRGLRSSISKKRNTALKGDRYLLLKREHDLQPLLGAYKLTNLLNEFPVFRTAHKLKEDLFKLYDCKTREEALAWYQSWKSSIPKDVEMEPFRDIAATIDRWEQEIFNYFGHEKNNAFVEGMNRAIRGIEDHGYGYSYEVLRAKVILGVGHKKKLYRRPKYGFNEMVFQAPDFGRKLFLADMPDIDYGVSFDAILDAINANLF